ncbi:MAG: TIGR02147 family protein, partial [Proteobacteria bacterium]
RKTISREKAVVLVTKLKVSEERKRYLLHVLGQSPERAREAIPSASAVYLRNPVVPSVFNALELTNADGNPISISKVIGVPVTEVKEALEILKKLGMVSLTNERGFKPTGVGFKSTDGVKSEDIRKFHLTTFELARVAMTHYPVNERDITTSCFAASAAKFEEMQQEIRRCHERLVAIGESDTTKDRVYRLGIALFPIPPLNNVENQQ